MCFDKVCRFMLTWGVALTLLSGCLSGRQPTPTPSLRVQTRTDSTVADIKLGRMSGVRVTDVAGGELRLEPGVTTGVYTSTVIAVEFPFNSVAIHWGGEVPAGSELRVEVRVEAEKDGWSGWQSLSDATWIPDKEQFYPETPLLLYGGRSLQYRVSFHASPEGASPVLTDITLVFMDTTSGPTTLQGKMMSRAAATTSHGVPAPPVIPRAGWGADESYRTWEPEYRPVSKIVVHHTVTPNNYSEEQGAAWVRAIYYYHAVTLGWGDIGYNYLIDKYGNIYEGRYGGPGVVGGHVYGYNYGTAGVAFIGTYGNYANSIEPTSASLDALVALSTWEASRSYINPLKRATFKGTAIPNLGGHRDYPPFSTSCPGDLLYAQLATVRQRVWERLRTYLPQYAVEWQAWEGLPDEALETGKTYQLHMRIRNVGHLEWAADGDHPVRVGYHWLDKAGQVIAQPPQEDLRTSLPHPVAFGEVCDLDSVAVKVPDHPGTYTLAWDMVHEGVTWFHDADRNSPLLKIAVRVETPPAESVIANGGFEYDGDWTIYETAHPARYVSSPVHSGARSLQTGIAELSENVYSYSSAEQTFVVPADEHVTLAYWYLAQIKAGDYAYVYLRPTGGWWQVLRIVRQDTPGWTRAIHSLDAYAGQQVTLRFGTFNDGQDGVSAMYVDDVRLQSGGGTPTPTPTNVPTSTPVPAPTSTPLPTPTFTPSPTPPACREIAVNGDFEADGGWTIINTPVEAHYTDLFAHSGTRSLQLGIADPAANRYTYSSAEQHFAVPAGHRARLSFWYNMPDGGGDGDYGYFVLRPDGSTWRVLRIVRERTEGWQHIEADVSHYASTGFTLRLGVRNDGGSAAAVMYVDTLSLQVCLP